MMLTTIEAAFVHTEWAVAAAQIAFLGLRCECIRGDLARSRLIVLASPAPIQAVAVHNTAALL